MPAKFKNWPSKDVLIEEYLTKNRSAKDIAKDIGISIVLLRRQFRKLGIRKDPKLAYQCTAKTNIKKYGFPNVFQNSEIKESIKKYNLEKYGVEFYTQTDEYKDKVANACLIRYGKKSYLGTEDCLTRLRATSLEKYGTEYPNQCDEVKLLIANTNLLRYGVVRPAQNKEVLEKMTQTNELRYGKKYYAQTNEFKVRFKQHCLEKYGVEHPSQNFDIHEKQQSFKHQKLILPSGKIITYQGYEDYGIYLLLESGYLEEDLKFGRDIPKVKYFHDNKNRIFYPDIYIISLNKLIDVKSEWTYRCEYNLNMLKQQAAIDMGYDFDFMVIDSKEYNNWKKENNHGHK